MTDPLKIPSRVTRLANRAAVLTLVAASSTLLGAVTLSTAITEGSGVLASAAAFIPLAAGLGAGAWTWRTRAELRRARAEEMDVRQVRTGGRAEQRA